MRHSGPEARRRDARPAARVVQHADDARRPLVARGLQAEAVDQLGIRRTAGDGRRPRVRHVREQRAERDDELDLELARDMRDVIAERAPAQVRLDAEHDDGVAAAAGKRGVHEGVLRPLDPAQVPVDERHHRARRLEVVEALRVDRRELDRRPRAREVGARERGALSPVVPAAESRDQHRPLEGRAGIDPKLLRHQLIVRGRQRLKTKAVNAAQTVAAIVTWTSTSHHGRCVRYWVSPITICTPSSASST